MSEWILTQQKGMCYEKKKLLFANFKWCVVDVVLWVWIELEKSVQASCIFIELLYGSTQSGLVSF